MKGAASPTEGRSARVRRQVLEATIEVLARQGIVGVRHGLIAELSGVHRTSIYDRWPTRDDLILDALGMYVQEVSPVPDTGDLRNDLVAFLWNMAQRLREPRSQALYRVTLSGPDVAPEIQQLGEEFWRRRYEFAQERFDRAVELGQIPPVDSRFLIEALTGPVMLRMSRGVRRFSLAEAERVVDCVLSGTRAMSASALSSEADIFEV